MSDYGFGGDQPIFSQAQDNRNLSVAQDPYGDFNPELLSGTGRCLPNLAVSLERGAAAARNILTVLNSSALSNEMHTLEYKSTIEITIQLFDASILNRQVLSGESTPELQQLHASIADCDVALRSLSECLVEASSNDSIVSLFTNPRMRQSVERKVSKIGGRIEALRLQLCDFSIIYVSCFD